MRRIKNLKFQDFEEFYQNNTPTITLKADKITINKEIKKGQNVNVAVEETARVFTYQF
ncbi:MAG: hypothetical protein GY870_09320 [archaeon]|nr:hypothetical protein [archaeon]